MLSGGFSFLFFAACILSRLVRKFSFWENFLQKEKDIAHLENQGKAG